MGRSCERGWRSGSVGLADVGLVDARVGREPARRVQADAPHSFAAHDPAGGCELPKRLTAPVPLPRQPARGQRTAVQASRAPAQRPPQEVSGPRPPSSPPVGVTVPLSDHRPVLAFSPPLRREGGCAERAGPVQTGSFRLGARPSPVGGPSEESGRRCDAVTREATSLLENKPQPWGPGREGQGGHTLSHSHTRNSTPADWHRQPHTHWRPPRPPRDHPRWVTPGCRPPRSRPGPPACAPAALGPGCGRGGCRCHVGRCGGCGLFVCARPWQP